jgi:hypothetical protein
LGGKAERQKGKVLRPPPGGGGASTGLGWINFD